MHHFVLAMLAGRLLLSNAPRSVVIRVGFL
jgi:hypothetical protein